MDWLMPLPSPLQPQAYCRSPSRATKPNILPKCNIAARVNQSTMSTLFVVVCSADAGSCIQSTCVDDMNYRRARTPGGTFFFTVVTHNRRPFLCSGENIALLRQSFRYPMDDNHPSNLCSWDGCVHANAPTVKSVFLWSH